MTPSKALFFFCLSFTLAIALESFIKIPAAAAWGFLVGAAICIIAGFFKKEALMFGLCLVCLVLGITRLQIFEFAMAHDALSKYRGGEKITLAGTIIAEPDIRPDSQKLTIKIENTKSVVLVTTNHYAGHDYHYFDRVKITGKLKTPEAFEGFDYKSYLAKEGIYSQMDFPTIEMLPGPRRHTIVSFAHEKILWVKGKFMDSIDRHFLAPGSFMLQGVVFGNDKPMPQELKDQFNATGLSHVTAVSGTNIVILISMLVAFLLMLGLWRGQAFYGAVILIWLYIIMIGFPVSGVRAAIMGSVGLLAGKLGRQNASSRVLTLTAAAMLMQNPMLLIYDVSFQLSFLASLGIIHIKPLIDYYLAFFPKEYLKYWLDIISVTLAAQIITLPLIVYEFGRLSLVAPLTNFLVVPIVELLTILGFLTSVAGAFSNLLGFIFSLPCLALLKYFTVMLNLFSKPWAVLSINHISWLWMAGYYVVLISLIWCLQKIQRPKFLG